MEKNYRIWKYKWNTKEIKNIDGFIEIFENLTQILKNWKEEGIVLGPNSKIDDDCATFYTINPEMAKQERFKQEDSDELKNKHFLKVPIFSKNEIIRQRFFKGIDAYYGMELSKGMQPLVSFVIKSYETNNYKFTFQFWEFNNESIFSKFVKDRILSTYIVGSREVIYFYHIDEKIEEDLLNLIKESANSNIPILFVGYDSILPKNPEINDQNIPTIQKYYNNFNSLYISTDNQGCMFRVLDKIIELFFK